MILHSFLQPFLSLLVTTLSSAFDSDREPDRRGVKTAPLPAISNSDTLPQTPDSTTESLCVCVCVFSSHSFWTSSSLDVPAGVTQEEGHTGFLIHLLSAVRALLFLARRIQPVLSLVDREVEFWVLTI